VRAMLRPVRLTLRSVDCEVLPRKVGGQAYDSGAVLWRKRMPYAEILEKRLPKTEHDEELRGPHGQDAAHRPGRHRQWQADLAREGCYLSTRSGASSKP
jgi:hypothetical protein